MRAGRAQKQHVNHTFKSLKKSLTKQKVIYEATSTKDFQESTEELHSTEFAQTLVPGRPDPNSSMKAASYQVDPIYWSEAKKYQVYEVRGSSLKREDYEYHTPLYKDLLTAVVPLRTLFRKEKDNNARKQIAKTEFDAWNSYLEARKEEIT